jgi:hypothetical protein
MPTLETLSEYLHDYAVKHRDKEEEMRSRRQEWIDAVTRLFVQLRQWLTEADKDGVLRIEEQQRELGEDALGGRYVVPQLRVVLGPREVFVRPMGRVTIGRVDVEGTTYLMTQGRVDLTDDSERRVLYRLLGDKGELWVLVRPDSFEASPLTREGFERVMLELL